MLHYRPIFVLYTLDEVSYTLVFILTNKHNTSETMQDNTDSQRFFFYDFQNDNKRYCVSISERNTTHDLS